MSKIKQVESTNSVKFNAVEIGSVDKSQVDFSISPIYKGENLYFQYLMDLKVKNFNDVSDFSAAFMTF